MGQLEVRFQDFVPAQIKRPGFEQAPRWETLGDALARANAWVLDEGVTVLNVETVVLPNMHYPNEEGSTDVALLSRGEMSTHWHQFMRVWFQVDVDPDGDGYS